LAAFAAARSQSLPTQFEKICWPSAGLAVERCGKPLAVEYSDAVVAVCPSSNLNSSCCRSPLALKEVGVKDDKAEKVMKLLGAKRGIVLNRERAITLNR